MVTLKQVWQFLQTDVRDLWTPTEAAESGIKISQAVLKLGLALGLFVPSVAIAAAGLSFVEIGVKGIKAYRDRVKKKPSLEECVAIVGATRPSGNEGTRSRNRWRLDCLENAILLAASFG